MISGESTILYIDDDLLNLEIFKETFKAYYNVILLSSTQDAEDVLRSNPVKVIISDQCMPRETGIDFIKRINAKYPEVIKMILTAYSSKDTALQAINDAGIYKYLVKPWKHEEMKDVIDTAIREYDLQVEKKELLIELQKKNQVIVEAYKKLELNERKFYSVFANSNDSSCILNMQREIIEVNQAFLNLIKYKGSPSNLGKINSLTRNKYPVLIDKAFELAGSKKKSFTEVELDHSSVKQTTIEISSNEITYNNDTYILAVIRDITERRTFEKKIVETIIKTQEEDRSRYACELHDGLGPLLSTLKMHVQWIANPDNSVNKEKIINHALHAIDNAIRSVKDIANNLSPHVLQRFGLVNAVTAYIENVKESCGIEFSVSSDLHERLKTNNELILYRIILECINNSIKHARPKKIVIRFIKQKNLLNISISDDGIGFDVDREMLVGCGMGLANIQNRVRHIGGKFTIESTQNKGTQINISIAIT